MVDVAPTQTVKSAASPGDLALVAHRGDRGVLLAMDLPQERTDRLAGFALYRKTPGGVERPLLNRLDFATPVTSATTPAERRWHPSDKAPFQKFRWVDMPSPVEAGTYRYTATARYFGGTGGLVDGPSAFVDIDLADEHLGALTIGFTRGYISSQAYADRFHNAPFEPDPPTVDFDTTPYRAQYQWLGFHARELVMSFLADCQSDLSVTLDVFAFDLNEPDVIRMMAGFGSRLRLYLDNSPTHVDHADKPKARPAMEPQAQKAIEATGERSRPGISAVLPTTRYLSHDATAPPSACSRARPTSPFAVCTCSRTTSSSSSRPRWPASTAWHSIRHGRTLRVSGTRQLPRNGQRSPPE